MGSKRIVIYLFLKFNNVKGIRIEQHIKCVYDNVKVIVVGFEQKHKKMVAEQAKIFNRRQMTDDRG